MILNYDTGIAPIDGKCQITFVGVAIWMTRSHTITCIHGGIATDGHFLKIAAALGNGDAAANRKSSLAIDQKGAMNSCIL